MGSLTQRGRNREYFLTLGEIQNATMMEALLNHFVVSDTNPI